MKSHLMFVTAAFALASGPAAAQGDPNLAFIPNNDPAMAKAIIQARASLPKFVERSEHPGAGEEAFAVKVGLGPAGRQEFFWLSPFKVADGKVSGQLDNAPETIEGYRKGQTVERPLSEVTDWMFMDHGKMRGNYSACVLLAREGRAAVKDYEKTYGADCGAPGG